MTLLQLDSIKLMFGEAKKAPFDASDVREEVLHVIPLQYEKTTDIAPDVRLTFYNAGHILGSSIAHFNLCKYKIHSSGVVGHRIDIRRTQ